MDEEKFELKQVQVRLKLSEAESLYSTEPMDTPTRASEVMAEALAQMDREYACVVNLDNSLRPINFNIVSIGGINSAEVPVQNVFKSAILSNAASVMMFHNHPSGNLTPSKEDRALTRRLVEAGNIMGIPVIDHIIVGGGSGRRYSLREENEELFRIKETEKTYESGNPERKERDDTEQEHKQEHKHNHHR